MSAALGNYYALDRRPATGTYFYCSMPVVYLQMVIIIASLPLQIAIAAKRGSSVLNTPGEHCNNAGMQLFYFSTRERISTAQGMNRRVVKSLVGIDIAQACHHILA